MSDQPPAMALDPAALDAAGRLPAQLVEITDFVVQALPTILPKLEPVDARRAAVAIVDGITRHFGGSYFYIPKSDAVDRTIRNLEIWAEFDGTPNGPRGVRALARRYRLTEQQVWNILRVERQHHQQRTQMALPL